MRYIVVSFRVVTLFAIAAACGATTVSSSNSTTTVPTPSPVDTPASSSSGTSSSVTATSPQAEVSSGLVTSEGFAIPVAPDTSGGPISEELTADLDRLFTGLEEGRIEPDDLAAVAGHGDARTAWLFTDILRFTRLGDQSEAAVSAFEAVAGVDLPSDSLGGHWKTALDYLIAWDLPAIDTYADYKARLFIAVEPGWAPFFADTEATLDWRLVTWGGVFIDDRPLGVREGCPRGCIPALDDPLVTDADGGDWLDDDSIVFGITVNGESRAYPKHQMETHEMVNDTLGGRRIGVPYCTLCGSAQAYFTDSVPEGIEVPVLRTSGLLTRSNKVMFDLVTYSVFNTFTGEAVSGPLREASIRLEQATVVTSTWGTWKEAHPDTSIVAQDGGIGYVYRLDPLGDRDANGPIFPVGDVDPRLDAQELVIGVEYEPGSVVAFPKDAAIDHLVDGGTVEFGGVTVSLDGSGLRALGEDGTEIATHEAFWFAWSQFWPETSIWVP